MKKEKLETEKKKAVIVVNKPFMKPLLIKPSGEVQISFSESMKQIDQVFKRDLD